MAKKKRGDSHTGGHGWYVSFADLMGLMMSFFVMLVAFSMSMATTSRPCATKGPSASPRPIVRSVGARRCQSGSFDGNVISTSRTGGVPGADAASARRSPPPW